MPYTPDSRFHRGGMPSCVCPYQSPNGARAHLRSRAGSTKMDPLPPRRGLHRLAHRPCTHTPAFMDINQPSDARAPFISGSPSARQSPNYPSTPSGPTGSPDVISPVLPAGATAFPRLSGWGIISTVSPWRCVRVCVSRRAVVLISQFTLKRKSLAHCGVLTNSLGWAVLAHLGLSHLHPQLCCSHCSHGGSGGCSAWGRGGCCLRAHWGHGEQKGNWDEARGAAEWRGGEEGVQWVKGACGVQ